jgi:hypothetical protein
MQKRYHKWCLLGVLFLESLSLCCLAEIIQNGTISDAWNSNALSSQVASFEFACGSFLLKDLAATPTSNITMRVQPNATLHHTANNTGCSTYFLWHNNTLIDMYNANELMFTNIVFGEAELSQKVPLVLDIQNTTYRHFRFLCF